MNARARLRFAALGAAAALALPSACTETRGGLGDACLKGDDCLSGVCSAQVCVGAPPLARGTSTIPPGPDAAAKDAGPLDASEADSAAATDASDDINALTDADDAG